MAPKTRWKKTRHQFFHIRDAKKLFRLSELLYDSIRLLALLREYLPALRRNGK